MHIHILGICGTFMAGIAAIAKASGHKVSGSDENVYPPMSTQLRKLGIEIYKGFDKSQLTPPPDCIVVGNVLSRGNSAIEDMLNKGIPYFSGPEWLANNVLRDKWVLAVAGTHGKTTASSMLAWILDYAGLSPGFLIGGICPNFKISARLSDSEFFVVEADEYDTAFFDKRAKFMHYRPKTLAITNLEFDHADIFSNLEEIIRQFHQLIRTIPSNGLIVSKGDSKNIEKVFNLGKWSQDETYSSIDSKCDWYGSYDLVGAKSKFSLYYKGNSVGSVNWSLLGEHNIENALAAISAANHVGVSFDLSIEALNKFKGVRRRLERIGSSDGITIFDDFAHHPTAIKASLSSVKRQRPDSRLIAILELRSNSMKMGIHKEYLARSLQDADVIFMLKPKTMDWDPAIYLEKIDSKIFIESGVDSLQEKILNEIVSGDQVLFMSNGSFSGLPRRVKQSLQSR
ncbi:MAG: UDP-N-acetylmuramate:L-alanyl-gamma-D-glutamyl-meso-diaminopimelate ligase [Gammaproteobacteria bacterium TMED78]|nr:MAG: UDP-N-acetylmuramate:L-alanyl-gamma-D-glutamyl-meso-diaminopimelate ligase [Gammaproteobacteria bacterium TMED78]